MIVTYKNNRYSCDLLKKCTLHDGTLIFLFRNNLALTDKHYIVAARSCGTTVVFKHFAKLSAACENYLDTICTYA